MAPKPNWNAATVAELRDALGLSQDAFSKTLGVRQQTVSEWETGAHKPTGASVRLLTMVSEQAAPYRVGRVGRVRPKQRGR
jgi:DNA-binding transcriptional regulator YiaG